jgi:CspA family cold shock protein
LVILLLPRSSFRAFFQRKRVFSLPTGTVKFFRDKLGWGFIENKAGADIFVHYKDIVGDGHRTLAKGEKVQFEMIDGPKGAKAVNVIRLSV